MRFVVLVYQDERVWLEADDAARERWTAQHAAFDAGLRDAGVALVATEVLHGVDAATTFRRRGDDVTLTDGPFAPTAEQLGGLYVLDAPDLDAVTGTLGLLPEYTLEVRPVAAL